MMVRGSRVRGHRPAALVTPPRVGAGRPRRRLDEATSRAAAGQQEAVLAEHAGADTVQNLTVLAEEVQEAPLDEDWSVEDDEDEVGIDGNLSDAISAAPTAVDGDLGEAPVQNQEMLSPAMDFLQIWPSANSHR